MVTLSPKLDDIKEQLNTTLVALVVIACLSVGLLWTTWNSVQAIWWPTALTNQQNFHPPQKINVSLLSDYHLLGANTSNLGDLPLASLGVTLIGIFADNQNKSTALITVSGGQSKMYHAGDKLAPNVTIDKILQHSLVVLHNGRLEKLAMPIQPLTFSNQLPDSGLWK